MRKNFLRIGSSLAFFAVIIGAFGAHILADVIGEPNQATLDTAVQYHFVHALAILMISAWINIRKTSFLIYAGWCFTIGILFFSGSLYLLSIRDWLGFEALWLGPITPLGGLLFIAGWALTFLASFQERPVKKRTKEEVSIHL